MTVHLWQLHTNIVFEILYFPSLNLKNILLKTWMKCSKSFTVIKNVNFNRVKCLDEWITLRLKVKTNFVLCNVIESKIKGFQHLKLNISIPSNKFSITNTYLDSAISWFWWFFLFLKIYRRGAKVYILCRNVKQVKYSSFCYFLP